MMWYNKYLPKSIEEWEGNKDVLVKLLDLIKNYKKGKAIILSGPTGVGKTASLKLVSNLLNVNLIFVDLDELTDKEKFKVILDKSKIRYDLFGKSRLIIIEDINSLSKQGILNVKKLISYSNVPVILTCYDIWDYKIRELKQESFNLEFKPLKDNEIASRILHICENEEILIDKDVLKEIVSNSRGDIRSAIIDLQSMYYNNLELTSNVMALREKKLNIFEFLSNLNKKNLNKSLNNFFYVDKDINEIFYWILENASLFSNFDIFNYLSKADIFNGYIKRRQYWRMLNYVKLLLIFSSVAFSKGKSWIKFQYPSRYLIFKKYRYHYNLLKGVVSKLSSFLHISDEKVSKDILYYSLLSRKYNLNLSKDEIKLLNNLLK